MRAVAVDWTGDVRPAHNLAVAEASNGVLASLALVSSREVAVDQLCRRASDEILVGLDFALSFPAWFVRSLGVASAPELWDVVSEQGECWLSQCPPPFWGRRGRRRPEGLVGFRECESAFPPVGGARPKSVFQIGGAGTVGTGSVRGMPFLRRLKAAGYAIWPFDEPRLPLVVEIWPRALTGQVVKSDPARRADYLGRFGDDAGAFVRLATANEHAFDAAVSAMCLSRLDAEVDALRRGEGDELLEGAIFPPALPPAPSGRALSPTLSRDGHGPSSAACGPPHRSAGR